MKLRVERHEGYRDPERTTSRDTMKPPPPRFDSGAKAPAAGGQGKDGAADPEPSKAKAEAGPGAAASSSMPPPPGKAFAPPPPRFSSAAADKGDAAADAKKSAARAAAVSAAAAAAAGATPAQRERLIAEAASSAMASASEAAKEGPPAHQAPREDPPQAPPAQRDPPALTYEPPAWGGPPEGIQYGLEVLKGGQVRPLAACIPCNGAHKPHPSLLTSSLTSPLSLLCSPGCGEPRHIRAEPLHLWAVSEQPHNP